MGYDEADAAVPSAHGRRIGRKGAYFFVIDAFIGSIIIIAAIVIIFSGYTSQPNTNAAFYSAEDFMNVIETTQVRNYGYTGNITTMAQNGTITDDKQTLLQQLVFFYDRCTLNDNASMKIYANELLNNALKNREGVSMSIEIVGGSCDSALANRTVTPLANANIVFSSSRIVILHNSSTSNYPPAIVKVKTWQ